MKKYIVLFCLLFFNVIVNAQNLKIVPVIQNEIHVLNGGLRSQFGGKSRIIIPIVVPTNTISLIYTVQAYESAKPVENYINLSLLVSTIITMNTPLTELLNNIKISGSTQTVDLFVLPSRTDANNFLLKNDRLWKTYIEYSRQACLECKVQIPANLNYQELFLGIRNPSSLDAIKVVVNIVAITN